MKRIFVHNPYFRIFAPPVYGVLVYLIILLINNNVEQIRSLFNNQEVYVCIALSLLSFESMRTVILLIERGFGFLRKKMFLQSMVTTIVSVGVILVAITQYYAWVIGFDISGRELIQFGAIFTLTSLLYNVLYIGNQYLHRENTLQMQQEHKLRENLESEFSSFRQEINPDLLYDSLEELILCLHKKNETAEELIDSLAALYRYQLIHRQTEFVSLTEELQAVRHWLRLANQKHNGNIHWTNLAPLTDVSIMPGALITALDSIVRNTLISGDTPLTITLGDDEDGSDYFVLHHILNDKLQPHHESKIAFQQLQRSYSHYSDRPFVQVKAGRENYIKFPRITVDLMVKDPA